MLSVLLIMVFGLLCIHNKSSTAGKYQVYYTYSNIQYGDKYLSTF